MDSSNEKERRLEMVLSIVKMYGDGTISPLAFYSSQKKICRTPDGTLHIISCYGPTGFPTPQASYVRWSFSQDEGSIWTHVTLYTYPPGSGDIDFPSICSDSIGNVYFVRRQNFPPSIKKIFFRKGTVDKTNPALWTWSLGPEIQVKGGLQVLVLKSSGYTNCVAGDVGKQVKDDGIEIGSLLSYNNSTRTWIIQTSPTILINSVITITSGTGKGSANVNSTDEVDGDYPDILVDTNGYIHIVYARVLNQPSWARSIDGGSTWIVTDLPIPGAAPFYGRLMIPSIDKDSANNLYIGIGDASGGAFARPNYAIKITYIGPNWTMGIWQVVSSGNSGHCQLRVLPDDRICIIYSLNASSNVTFRKTTNPSVITAWNAEKTINIVPGTQNGYLWEYSLSFQDANNLFAIYTTNVHHANLDIVMQKSTDGGLNWSAIEYLSDDNSGNRMPNSLKEMGIDTYPKFTFRDGIFTNNPHLKEGKLWFAPADPPIHLESLQDDSSTSNLGTITFDSIAYALPNDIVEFVGSYSALYNPASGYGFDHWVVTDGIGVLDPIANPTTATVVAPGGTLRAIYKAVASSADEVYRTHFLGILSSGDVPILYLSKDLIITKEGNLYLRLGNGNLIQLS